MGQFNSNLTFYRSALKMQDNQNKQKKVPPSIFNYLEGRNKMIKSTSTMDRPKMVDYYKQKEMKMKKMITPKDTSKKSLFNILEPKNKNY